MIALIHIYCSTSLCVIYKSLLIHDIQVLIYRGSTNERLPGGGGVAHDSYYNETDRVIYNKQRQRKLNCKALFVPCSCRMKCQHLPLFTCGLHWLLGIRNKFLSSMLCTGFYTKAAAALAVVSSEVIQEGSRGVYTYRVSTTLSKLL